MQSYSTAEYTAFLASKRLEAQPTGFHVDRAALNPQLFPFQADIVRWALARGRACIWADCGLGKSPMQLEWSRHVHTHTGRNVLILAPLAVSQQTVREGEKFGIAVTHCRTGADVQPGINITNYEMLGHFDPSQFGAIVLDECFAPGTLIDTPTGRKHIEDVQLGDKIINASGVDTVADVHRREVPYAIKITIAGQQIICSPNHPFFTQRGWVGAQDLVPGDHITQTVTAMRLVRQGVHAEVHEPEASAFLRSILLSELAYESTGASGEGTYARGSGEAWRETACMVSLGQPESTSGERSYTRSQSSVSSRSTRKDLPPIESHAPRTFRAWGQWQGPNGTTTDVAGHTWRGMDSGVCLVTGQADSWLSNTLQDRLSASRAQNRYRSGWALARIAEGSGCEEGCKTGFARVDGFEVLEPGHPELECYRDADGKLYFYDLGATQHPSFSVNGLLVHNSSILKAYDGKTRTTILEFARTIPFRLACSATPAPNDYMELGNHAEFMAVMSRVEMLSMFFVHDGGDTSKWRLKGHAESEFWRWLCSWAVMIRHPSDLGYDDAGFILPPLEMHSHVIDSNAPLEGMLVAVEAQTLTERRQARRASLSERVQAAAELANSNDEPWLIWCDLNDEGDELERLIPGSVQVAGRHDNDFKEWAAIAFSKGAFRVLISKPSIFGFGLNFQHCPNVAFVGLSDSYEQFYQAVRRCWRFGQQQPVQCHMITAEVEGAVVANIARKEADAERMAGEMVEHMHTINEANIKATGRVQTEYTPSKRMIIPNWIQSEVRA